MNNTSRKKHAGNKIENAIANALFNIGGLGFCFAFLCYIGTIALTIIGWLRFNNPTAFDEITSVLRDIGKWVTLASGIIWCAVLFMDTLWERHTSGD